MKKHLIKCIFIALTFGMLVSFNAAAAEENSSIIIDESGNISLTSENAEQDGITAIQLSLKVETAPDAVVSFDFNPENNVKISDSRYNEDEKTLNIYMADNEPIFKDSDSLNIGSVSAIGNDGNSVDVKISVVEDSMKFVSQNTLTARTFSVDGAGTVPDAPEVPSEPETESNSDGKSFEVEKTFPSSYTITIPDGTTSLEAGQNFTVSAENVLIEHGETLELSVTSGNNWKLKDRNNPANQSGIAYSMGYGDGNNAIASQSATILTIGDGKKSDNVKLTVISIAEPDMAGTFADTLTFSVKVS